MENLREPLNFLYPSEKARTEMKERRYALSKLPETYLDDLQVRKLLRYFSPENHTFSENIFRELCTDPAIIKYRCDAIEDIMAFPRLAPAVLKCVRVILDNHHDSLADADRRTPDTFAALSEQIEALGVFEGAVEEIIAYENSEGKNVKSEAFGKFFEYFRNIYDSEKYKELKTDLADLKEAFGSRIRSVTVAINFNEEMRPVSVGVVDYSDTHVTEKPSVFDRIFYRTAKRSDVTVKNLHTKFLGDSKDANETDKKLFEELEKVTSAYMGKLTKAIRDYTDIDFKEISAVSEGVSFLQKAAELVSTCKAKNIPMCRPVILPAEDRRIALKGAFDINFFRSAAAKPHEKGEALLVTNDITFDGETGFYLLSGANNGGKTTFVRAVGLCAVFAQAGLYVPAERAEISPADFIFTHFPKEEEVGINTSRFTEEIKDLKTIAENMTDKSLLFMNESIQSTTPAECLEIAGEFVRIFTMLGARGIFATHLAELALKMDEINNDPDNRTKIDSITVCVNKENGDRTYRIVRSMPEPTSYASVIFDRFGISADEIRRRIHEKK